MDKKNQGAWLIHHGKKLQAVTNYDFDTIGFAGQCGILLSAVSAESQEVIPIERVQALSKANNINPRSELPTILTELEKQRLIVQSHGNIEVLGLTSGTTLEHTANLFNESGSSSHEDAVLSLSEIISNKPVTDKFAVEYVSDTFFIASNNAKDYINLSSELGFFDSEVTSNNEKLLFNGNLFKKQDAKKVSAVLSSLQSDEEKSVLELNKKLLEKGCIPLAEANRIVHGDLFKKLHGIGMFDVNLVGNESGRHFFVTSPSSFSKFTNSIVDDAFDLAKAFVSSLTYGMTASASGRGRIQMITALMNKLIRGDEVGPATAIGRDYQALELKGVLKVIPKGGGMFSMRLLKPEIGRLALSVIQEGTTMDAIDSIPGASVSTYIGPEEVRASERKRATSQVKVSTMQILNEIRTGGF